jgi:hypothetical protein
VTYWLHFEEMPKSAERKTLIFAAVTKEGQVIGQIRWFAAWRKYCFYPFAETVWEENCLRQIADFIEGETKKQRIR